MRLAQLTFRLLNELITLLEVARPASRPDMMVYDPKYMFYYRLCQLSNVL